MIYSKVLLMILIIVNMFLYHVATVISMTAYNQVNKNNITVHIPSFFHSTLIWLISLLLTWGVVCGVLIFIKKNNRLVQVLISLAAIDIILKLLKICIIILLKYSPKLAIVGLIPLLYWEFIIYIFVFSNSFDTKYFKASIFALIYMIMQYNIGGLVASYVIPGPYVYKP